MDKLALMHFTGRIWKEREEAGPQDPGQRRDNTILIVDDSRTIVHALKFMLERYGYYAVAAYNGEEGVEAAQKWDPDLILMDIVMPVMNGFEAVRTLIHDPQTKQIPIIMMSCTNRPSDRMWGARLGAKAFLSKPIRMNDLLPKIDTVLTQQEQSHGKKRSKQLSLLDNEAANDKHAS